MKKVEVSISARLSTVALVDDKDFNFLNKWKWVTTKDPKSGTAYAVRNETKDGKSQKIAMHREVLKCKAGLVTDHIDGDGLNNQRSNLRECTPQQNAMNRKLSSNNTSGYKGVSWSKHASKWQVAITLKSKIKSLGYFNCLVKAAKKYDEGARKYHGEFARLNFTK